MRTGCVVVSRRVKRFALGPLTVLRLDVGRRFSSDRFRGYGLSSEQKKPGFVSFFFGYNY